MKTVLFLIISLTSFAALSFPKVNDHVVYNGLFHLANTDQKVGFIQELNLTAYSAETKMFTYQEIVGLPDGREDINETQVLETEFTSREQVLEIVKNCAEMGGKPERVTVMAGEYETCLIEQANGDKAWMGDVPFAIVKSESFDADKNMISLELSNFSQAD